MSAKKFFEKQKQKSNLRGLKKGNLQQLSSSVESKKLVEEHLVDKERFIPDVDYTFPKNFAKFGSAKKYYDDAFKRIHRQYPYDGSRAEKLAFVNQLNPLEKYIYEQRYPKTNGFALFSPSGWGTATAVGNPATKEYITFYGGPNENNIYHTASARGNNLKLDYVQGNTVEFWLKKDGWTNPDTVNRYEVIFDLRPTASTTNKDHRQFEIYLDGNSAATKKNIYLLDRFDGTGMRTILSPTLDTGLVDIADGKWHHYAITVEKNEGNDFITASLYVDGEMSSMALSESHGVLESWSGYAAPGNEMVLGAISGYVTNTPGGTSAGAGWYKMSASLDEFRFWKTRRSAKEIGRNYFVPVYGGTNTDDDKYYYSSSVDNNAVDLGVYFKFNEGITGDSNIDALVLDYSGRVSNGTWNGYSSKSRSTASAIVQAGAANEEELDPILYETHPDVISVSASLMLSGSDHDFRNNAALYNTIPQWIRDEDEDKQELLQLTQIMGSYLDTLHGQIDYLSRLKEPAYLTGSNIGNREFPFSKKLLESVGFDSPDLFIDMDVIEEILSRDEHRVYEDKIFNIKNLIYKNVYNNLAYINKAKGTEKAFRNLFRCFGADDDLFRINVYSDKAVFELEDKYEITTTKRKAIDFSGINVLADRNASIFQYPSSSEDYGYITASNGDQDIPVTVEAEIIFPKIPKVDRFSTLSTVTSASLFGCHRVTGAYNSVAVLPDSIDRGFQVYAVKPDEERTYFMVTSSHSAVEGTFPPLSSAMFYDVYDDSKWNIAVRVRPEIYPWSSYVSSSFNAVFEFYGVQVDHGVVVNEFSESATLPLTTAGRWSAGSNKKFYIGAKRENFEGDVECETDVRFSSLRYWADYLTGEEIKYHAMDPNNYGRTNPNQNSHVWEGNVGFLHVPNIDTLALNWDFSDVTGSLSDGTFYVHDLSSGSVSDADIQTDRYGVSNYSQMVKRNHTGKAVGFTPVSEKVSSVEFLGTARLLPPENMNSSDMVKILSRDEASFSRESRPSKNYFSIEASMYDVISRNMLNFFASIDDFNNLIGEPIHRYRGRYKGLEKLRQLFFERVTGNPDVDKFVNLYKWLDSAMDSVLANLVPMSANVSDKVRSVIESHVLERNKYRHKLSIIKDFVKVDNNNKLRSVQEGGSESVINETHATLPKGKTFFPQEPRAAGIGNHGQMRASPAPEYKQNRAPVTVGNPNPTDQSKSAWWWKHRAERDVAPFAGIAVGKDILDAAVASHGHSFRINVPTGVGGAGKDIVISLSGSVDAASNDHILVSSSNQPNADDTAAAIVAAINGSSNLSLVKYGTGSGDQTLGLHGVTAEIGSLTASITLTANMPGFGEEFVFSNLSGALYQTSVRMEGGFGGDIASNTSRVQLWNNITQTIVSESYKPYTDSFQIQRAYHGGPNIESHQVWDYYKGTQTHDEMSIHRDGISSSIKGHFNLDGDPFVHDETLTGSKYPMIAADVNINKQQQKYSGKRLPFIVYSSSIRTGYRHALREFNQTSSINHIHHDLYGPLYEVPMQGPFAEENVGGNIYRHGQLFVTSSDDRNEGFRIEVNHMSLQVSHPRNVEGHFAPERPYGTYTREEYAKRPVVIKNIKHSPPSNRAPEDIVSRDTYVKASNYKKDYEIISAGGRIENSRHWVKVTSGVPETVESSYFADPLENGVAGIKDYRIPDRTTGSDGTNSFIIVNRYSSRGGAPVESEGFLDIKAGELTPYNALPWQNLTVRRALNELYTRHTATGGLDSFYGTPIQSFHKAHRNTAFRPNESMYNRINERAGVSAYAENADNRPTASIKEVHDNMWVSHQIPQTDLNYKWIRDSYMLQRTGSLGVIDAAAFVGTIGDVNLDSVHSNTDLLPLFGFDYTTGSTALSFVSASEYGSYDTASADSDVGGGDSYRAWGTHRTSSAMHWSASEGFLPTDFVGMNYHIYEPVSGSSNLLGYVSGNAPLPYDTASMPLEDIGTYLHMKNMYGEGFIDVIDDDDRFSKEAGGVQGRGTILNAILLNRNGPYGYPSWKQIRTGEHPVARFHKRNNILENAKDVYESVNDSIQTRITRIQQAPVTSKYKEIQHNLTDFSIEYSFANEHHYYGTTYESGDREIKDHNEKMNGGRLELEDTILYNIVESDNVEWENFKYSEVVWPKAENAYRELIRTRPLWNQRWRGTFDDVKHISIASNRQTRDTVKRVVEGARQIYRLAFGGLDVISTWPMDVHDEIATNYQPASYDFSGELMQFDNCVALQSGRLDVAGSTVWTNAFLPCRDANGSYFYFKYGRNYNICRPHHLVHHQAGTGAYYHSYDDYVTDIRLLGQDYSLMTQFALSDYVRTVFAEHNGDFYADIFNLQLTGTALDQTVGPNADFGTLPDINENTKLKFLETYAHSEELTQLEPLKENFGEPDAISIKASGILKLLPINGFYPMNATLRLATEFSASYARRTTHPVNNLPLEDSGYKTMGMSALSQPFYMPGIMYNSIKAGLAVDYPIVDHETYFGSNSTHGNGGGPVLNTGSYFKRLPFEAILEPDVVTRRIKGTSSYSDGITLYYYDTELSESTAGSSLLGHATQGGSASLGRSDGVYELAAHNFFAEVPNFFINGLTTLESRPIDEWNFEGPMKIGDEIRKFSMDVKVVKSDSFTMHDNPGYFGHHPYWHHVPPYYAMRGDVNNIKHDSWITIGKYNHVVCSASTIAYPHPFTDQTLSQSMPGDAYTVSPAAAHARNEAIARIEFDPTRIANEDPVKFNSGKFTFEDIVANSKIYYINEDLEEQFAVDPMAFNGNLRDKYMPLSASVNMYNKTVDKKWVIGTKWETPVLNFANVYATSSAGTSSALYRTDVDTKPDNAYRGMWHQYGQECKDNEGLFFTVADTKMGYESQNLTGSLAKACGFGSNIKRIGQLKPQKTLREAVVAIPFFIGKDGKEVLFDIPLDQFEQALSNLEQAEEAAKTVKRKGEEYVLSVDNSISDMIYKMRRYMMLPQFDFVKYRDKTGRPILAKQEYNPVLPPFAAYIFEFSTILSREDLRKIWQGVLPEIGVTAEKQDITLEHPIKDGELIGPRTLTELGLGGKLPEDVRWKIFKIKRRAANNYYQMIEEQYNLTDNYSDRAQLLSEDYGFNWPYDYCSLVEFGKVEVGFEFTKQKRDLKKVEQVKERQSRSINLTKRTIPIANRAAPTAGLDMAAKSLMSMPIGRTMTPAAVTNALQAAREAEQTTGTTSNNAGHVHQYIIDEDGNGEALMAYSPDDSRIKHKHKIVNGIVQTAQSDCYPNCEVAYGAKGLGPHIHQIGDTPTEEPRTPTRPQPEAARSATPMPTRQRAARPAPTQGGTTTAPDLSVGDTGTGGLGGMGGGGGY